jgi:energy-coupling factor transporter ATP-binding protein EcfA2
MPRAPRKNAEKSKRVQSDRESQPIYFLSLTVEDILCFKDKQVLDLSDRNGNPAQWTVILGDNGVGKSTLLRCLAGMETKDYTNDERMIKGIDDSHNHRPILFLQEEPVRSWDLTPVKNGTVNAGFICNTYFPSVQVFNENNSPIETHEISVSINQLATSHSCNKGKMKDFSGVICYGYGATRHLGDISLSASVESRNSESLFSEKSSLINAGEWLLQTDYSCRTASGSVKERLLNTFEQVKAILIKILPDVDDIRIAPADEYGALPRPEFLTPYGWVGINDLGLGYRSTIAWIVDLAVRLFRRYPDSPDPLAEPAIVLVDEIDLHLHPRWQRTIMDFLTERFPNTQFIVTAHSPLVVQAAQNANIVLLRREGDRVIIENNPEIIQNWRVDQVLTSVFELPSSRPPQVEALIKRHDEILAKPALTDADEIELQRLSEQIGPLPTAENLDDIEAMDIIRQAAKLLKQV